ncbi:MAG: RNA polymerase sigma factor [Saprospiraceae bacterium]
MNPIWQSLITGEHGALELLYRQHGGALLRYGKQFAEMEVVKDAVHDLFVRLWDKHETLNPAANPRPYLLIALRNDLLRANKKASKTGELSEAPEDETPSIESELVDAEKTVAKNATLASAVGQLSERERELIELRFTQNLDYEDIVEVTGISYQSARNTLARAIGKLRKSLGMTFLLSCLGTKLLFDPYLLETLLHAAS